MGWRLELENRLLKWIEENHAATRSGDLGRTAHVAEEFDEIISVLRNWTDGDLRSIALCVGVLVHHLAGHPELQSGLRDGVPDAEMDWSSTRCCALHWTSANRDAAIFGDPDSFDPAGHAADNLVYGAGPHACPGRWLATLELRITVRALLAGTTSVTLDSDRPAERAVAPVGGRARVPVILS